MTFSHLHEDCNSNVVAIVDVPHCFQNIRGALAHLKGLRIEYCLPLGNKLTEKHIKFHQNKMKVALAMQAIASKSVGRAVKWCHSQGFPGFQTDDTLATALFFFFKYLTFSTVAQ
uniref:Putative LOC101846817 [Aplysia californica] n=1 Tax=Lepeophtheirus salmonis TaxID=72036 RepID=A0A0K2VEW6_LEPSM